MVMAHVKRVGERQGICATCSHHFLDHRVGPDGFACTRCKCVRRHWHGKGKAGT